MPATCDVFGQTVTWDRHAGPQMAGGWTCTCAEYLQPAKGSAIHHEYFAVMAMVFALDSARYLAKESRPQEWSDSTALYAAGGKATEAMEAIGRAETLQIEQLVADLKFERDWLLGELKKSADWNQRQLEVYDELQTQHLTLQQRYKTDVRAAATQARREQSQSGINVRHQPNRAAKAYAIKEYKVAVATDAGKGITRKQAEVVRSIIDQMYREGHKSKKKDGTTEKYKEITVGRWITNWRNSHSCSAPDASSDLEDDAV